MSMVSGSARDSILPPVGDVMWRGMVWRGMVWRGIQHGVARCVQLQRAAYSAQHAARVACCTLHDTSYMLHFTVTSHATRRMSYTRSMADLLSATGSKHNSYIN